MQYTDDNVFLFYKKDSWASQHYSCLFEDDFGRQYLCGEQYMMRHKALLFGDSAAAEAIMCTKDPVRMRDLGRGVSNFNEAVWEGHRQLIVYEGNIHKFRSLGGRRAELLDTENRRIGEASPDKIWGVGLPTHDPRAKDPKNWIGRNLLGYALERVRMYFA